MEALRHPDLLPEGVESVSIDHFDADGVIALALLCVEGLAAEHGAALVEAARVGDFDVVHDRAAALIAFGVGCLGDPGRVAAILGPPVPDGDGMDRTAWAATEALRVLPSLVADPERHRGLWEEEASAFDEAQRAVSEGWATMEERADHDLAVVRVDTTHPNAPGAAWGSAALHPGAVHLATPLLRVATIAGGRVEVRYRYESWVRLESSRPRLRVDLSAVAAELSAMESAGARWVFDGAGAITPALHLAPGAPSALAPEDVVDLVCARLEILDDGPAAWDPYGPPTRAIPWRACSANVVSEPAASRAS